MADEQIDQDSLAAEWGVALEAEQKAAVKIPGDGTSADAEGGSGAEAMAAQWANMADDGHFSQGRKAAPNAS
jgi:flagellar motor switch protein FliM